MKTSVGEI